MPRDEDTDPKHVLHRYLRTIRTAVLWKLDGLSEHDLRRPLTPTGTNLLGVVKHLAGVEAGYFGDCFGRPVPDLPEWYAALMDETLEDNGDMWATAEESRESIVGLYEHVAAHADTVIDALDLDAEGVVPWWGEDGTTVTLHLVLVHVVSETHRHAGQMDIVRELIDGAAGLREASTNLPPGDAADWAAYRQKVQETADRFA